MIFHQKKLSNKGFSIVELLVVMTAVGFLLTAIVTFFNSSIIGFFKLQDTGLAHSELSSNTDKLARTLRGIQHIDTAGQNTIVAYAYFSVYDTNISRITYEIDANQLLAIVQPTSFLAYGPGIESTLGSEKTEVVIDTFSKPYVLGGSTDKQDLFTYETGTAGSTGGASLSYDLNGNVIDPSLIRAITINLGVHRSFYKPPNDILGSSFTVHLRNN